jgi:hypothetical protein
VGREKLVCQLGEKQKKEKVERKRTVCQLGEEVKREDYSLEKKEIIHY